MTHRQLLRISSHYYLGQRALVFIWKDLKITSKANRVPTCIGSIAELNLLTERPVTGEEVKASFRNAAITSHVKSVVDVLENE